jgi:hypothetical protein
LYKPNNPSIETETAETGLPRTEREQKENKKKTITAETEIEQKRPMCLLVFLVEQKQNRN